MGSTPTATVVRLRPLHRGGYGLTWVRLPRPHCYVPARCSPWWLWPYVGSTPTATIFWVRPGEKHGLLGFTCHATKCAGEPRRLTEELPQGGEGAARGVAKHAAGGTVGG